MAEDQAAPPQPECVLERCRRETGDSVMEPPNANSVPPCFAEVFWAWWRG